VCVLGARGTGGQARPGESFLISSMICLLVTEPKILPPSPTWWDCDMRMQDGARSPERRAFVHDPAPFNEGGLYQGGRRHALGTVTKGDRGEGRDVSG
jgi:hypothetical protein